MSFISQEKIERKVGWLIIMTLVTVSFGGLAEIVPLFFQDSTTKPIEGVKPYNALQLAGRDVYVREGCYNCHSQMIRPFRAETIRYGHYSVAGESVYDHPFQWGSKRTGPDLAREGGRNSDDWHYQHLMDPRSVVPQSNMPAFAYLKDAKVDGETMQANMRALNKVGLHKYSDEEIANAPKVVEGKTEMDAVVAYLQGLGLALKK
ncbi:MAG: cytochrome-c oxidase, cbb3-type subunit II [Formosimonas sp.]|jgi:cytochrome c oxidase cbb3-type subunit 2